ncbi:MAG TPA: hypothetical protein VI146_03810, partial [Nitrososphaeraceae archaeon]
RDAYQKQRFDLFLKTRDLTGVPLYIGEWNNVVRTRDGAVFKINPGQSDFTKSNAAQILGAFKKAGVWGTAFWKWDYRDADTTSFNLVSDSSGKLVPTKYFGILKDTVESIYGSSSLPQNSNEPIRSLTNAPETGLNVSSMSTGTATAGASTSEVKSTSEAPTTSNTYTNTGNTSAFNNTQSSSYQGNNLRPLNTNTKSPDQYENLNNLVHDLKNHVIINEEFPLSAFQDSGAYKGADKQTQDCIHLAALIGKSLTYREIVHCVEDANYFANKLSSKKSNNDAIDTTN